MDVGIGPHPNPTPDPHHRKIELQSLPDLIYLRNNLTESARQKIDLHFPPSAYRQSNNNKHKGRAQPATTISLDGADNPEPSAAEQSTQNPTDEHDPLRTSVEDLVHAYISRIWSSAARNITVNGLDVPLSTDPPSNPDDDIQPQNGPQEQRECIDFTYEPYDGRLQAKVASLYGEVETLTAQVSRLRRMAPKQGAEMYQRQLKQEMDRDEEEHEREMAAMKQKAEQQQQNILGVSLPTEDWYADTKNTYEQGVSELSSLAGLAAKENDGNATLAAAAPAAATGQGASLTETVGKLQRARTVAMEFE
jgi:kinetochor protein Mis14/NSL1